MTVKLNCTSPLLTSELLDFAFRQNTASALIFVGWTGHTITILLFIGFFYSDYRKHLLATSLHLYIVGVLVEHRRICGIAVYIGLSGEGYSLLMSEVIVSVNGPPVGLSSVDQPSVVCHKILYFLYTI